MEDYKRITGQKWSDDIDLKQELGYSYIYKRLAELEDKIEQGTLIELPCKVGDIFYYANELRDIVEKHKVTAIEFSSETRIRTFYNRSTTEAYIAYFLPSYYGKTVFLTREEAEKRLKELQE